MDQTSVYCNLGARTTVDVVGTRRVAATAGGKGSFRCTLAILVCADGRMGQPLDVDVMGPFKGHLRNRYMQLYGGGPAPRAAHDRRRDILARSIYALAQISSETIQRSFRRVHTVHRVQLPTK